MITRDQASALLGATCYDRNRAKIGSVGQLYYDTVSDRPAFASLNTGAFAHPQAVVPISEAELTGIGLVVPYDKDTVRHAPSISVEADEPLAGDEIARLYAYYDGAGPAAPDPHGERDSF